MATFSKTQIDRLGDRLRRGPFSQDDLRLLDQYRRSFGTAYETVITIVRDRLQLEPTGRPAKSTSSIIEKLRRESIRLNQVQDIAGCRVVVADIVAQDQTIAMLREAFPEVRVTDRRTIPNYGYRAVHVIVTIQGTNVEVQVRSALQHLWAELSEGLADVVDSSIKYGGGNQTVRDYLSRASEHIAHLEELERDLNSSPETISEQTSEVQQYQEIIARMKNNLAEWFPNFISQFEVKKR